MTLHRSLSARWSGLLRPGRLATLVRYGAVSGVATSTSLVVLGVLVGVLGVGAALANVVATALGTIPSFELNRRWVWAYTGRRSIARQVAPFATLSFAGLVLSTLAVRTASAHTASLSRTGHTLAVEAANVAAYGGLWVLQFVVLDRVLFRQPAAPPAAVEPAGALVGAGRGDTDRS